MIPARPDAFNPVPIFSRYVDAQDNLHGLKPFLWTQADGSPPTHSWFMARLHCIFPRDIGGHSLRAGSTTAYALQGMLDDHIQGLGRWSSDTFKIYIRKNPTLLHALITGSEESNCKGVHTLSIQDTCLFIFVSLLFTSHRQIYAITAYLPA